MNVQEKKYHKLIINDEELAMIRKLLDVAEKMDYMSFTVDEDELLEKMAETLDNYNG